MQTEKNYARFDSRLAVELEKRDEVRGCGSCTLAIGEVAGGVLLGIFGGPGGAAVGAVIAGGGVDALNSGAC